MIRAAETIQMTDTGRQRRYNEDSMYVRAPVFVVAAKLVCSIVVRVSAMQNALSD